MADYDVEDRAGAAEDLAPISQGGAGQLVTITRPGTGGTFDPMTETTTGATSPAVEYGSGIEEAYSAFSIAGGLVAAGDVKFLMSALAFAADETVTDAALTKPVADRDILTKADGDWAIKRVEALGPAGLDITYTLQLRRGA